MTYVLAIAHAERGELLAAEDAVTWYESTPFRPVSGLARSAIGRLLTLKGEHEAAGEVLDEVERGARASGHLALAALALGHRVDAAIDAGDPTGVSEARSRLDAVPVVGTTVSLTMSRLLAAAADGDTDAAEAAIGHATVNGLQVEAALARAALGVGRGDAKLVTDAYDALDRLGAVSRRRAVATELRRRGQRVPSRRNATSRFSQVEHDVAALVAQGLTNREVAAQMSLSPKTVEAHLSRLYRRTGCRTRVELALAVKAGRLEGHEPSRWDATSNR